MDSLGRFHGANFLVYKKLYKSVSLRHTRGLVAAKKEIEFKTSFEPVVAEVAQSVLAPRTPGRAAFWDGGSFLLADRCKSMSVSHFLSK
jgi:hypothetical protein